MPRCGSWVLGININGMSCSALPSFSQEFSTKVVPTLEISREAVMYWASQWTERLMVFRKQEGGKIKQPTVHYRETLSHQKCQQHPHWEAQVGAQILLIQTQNQPLQCTGILWALLLQWSVFHGLLSFPSLSNSLIFHKLRKKRVLSFRYIHVTLRWQESMSHLHFHFPFNLI